MAILTVKDTGGDHATLAAAVTAADPGDTIEISGQWSGYDTAPVTIDKANLTIRAVGEARHPGFIPPAPTHYRLRVDSGDSPIVITAAECVIDGLEVSQQGDIYFYCIKLDPVGAATVALKNLILWSPPGQNRGGIYTASGQAMTVTVENCMISGFKIAGIADLSGYGSGHTWHVNSSTIFDNGWGYSSNVGGGIASRYQDGGLVKTWNVLNCLVAQNRNHASAYDFRGITTAGINVWDIHNTIGSDGYMSNSDPAPYACLDSRAATDADAPGAGDWVIFQNVTTLPYDLRLKDNAQNDAQNMHGDATGAGLAIPAVDIAGTARPQATLYDCGAFELGLGAPQYDAAVGVTGGGEVSAAGYQGDLAHLALGLVVSGTVLADLQAAQTLVRGDMEDLAARLAVSGRTLRDLPIFLALADGETLRDLALGLEITDGETIADLRLALRLTARAPLYRAVLAQRIGSIRKVV